MGSPNFFTGRELGLNVGMNFYSAAERLYGENASGMDFDEYDNEQVDWLITNAYRLVQEAIDDMEVYLLNHSLEVKSGYHSGFQVYVKEIDDPTSFAANIFQEEGEVYLLDPDGYRVYSEDLPSMANFYTLKEIEDEWGGKDWELVVHEKAILDYLGDEKIRANHELAKIALEYGLNEVIGLGYTSSLARDEDNKAYLEAYLEPSFDAPEQATHVIVSYSPSSPSY